MLSVSGYILFTMVGAAALIGWLGFTHAPVWQPLLVAICVIINREITGYHSGLGLVPSHIVRFQIIKSSILGILIFAVIWGLSFAASYFF
jgi:hypothetical protein